MRPYIMHTFLPQSVISYFFNGLVVGTLAIMIRT